MFAAYRDLFASLSSHKVEYVAIGGFAAIAHGVPRVTVDVDLLVRATRANIENLLLAFQDAGLGTASLTTADDVLANEITIFKDRVRVDVQIRTPGLTFDDAFRRRKTVRLADGTPVYIVAVEDLIASKRAAGRPQDLEDVRLLEQVDKPKP